MSPRVDAPDHGVDYDGAAMQFLPLLSLFLAFVSDEGGRPSARELFPAILKKVRLLWLSGRPVPIPVAMWPDGKQIVRIEARYPRLGSVRWRQIATGRGALFAYGPLPGSRKWNLISFSPRGGELHFHGGRHRLRDEERLCWFFLGTEGFPLAWRQGVFMWHLGEPLVIDDVALQVVTDNAKGVLGALTVYNREQEALKSAESRDEFRELQKDLPAFPASLPGAFVDAFLLDLDKAVARPYPSVASFTIGRGSHIIFRAVLQQKLDLEPPHGAVHQLEWVSVRPGGDISNQDDELGRSTDIMELLDQVLLARSEWIPYRMNPGILLVPPKLLTVDHATFLRTLGLPEVR
jgi:hypothetical protein